jgi:hypothetical protein
MSVVIELQVPGRSLRGPAILLSLAGLLSLAFFVVAALPYLTNPALNPVYDGVRPALLAHIGFGTLALFAGPVQIWLGLRDQRMTLHKNLGFVYMLGVAGGSAAAFAMVPTPSAGFVFGAGLAGLAIAWLTTTGMAFLAVKRHLYDQHKEWMIRSYVVTLGFVIFRVGDVGMERLGIGDPLQRVQVMSWACWAVPLLVTELFLQSRKILAAKT